MQASEKSGAFFDPLHWMMKINIQILNWNFNYLSKA